MTLEQTWFDRVAGFISPTWQMNRLRARIAADFMRRNYEGAAVNRRTQGWRRTSTDGNQATGPFIGRLRDVARDLVRNNPFAEAGLSTIVDHTVGWGIVAKPKPANALALKRWKQWAESTACDADGRNDFYGLQKLVLRGVVESGEVLVRKRLRRLEDRLPIPLQLQVLEPDFIDTSKDSLITTSGGGRIINGIQFDALGKRVGYWLFTEHPGSGFATATSQFVPASQILHVYKATRPHQVRGVTGFAPVLLRFKDFDEFEDATLMKQKVAALLTVLTTDATGAAPPLGNTDNAGNADGGTLVDELYPGQILNLPPGRTVDIVQPPRVGEYSDYCKTSLRAIATGLGVSYEDLTGDYTGMPFSAARMSHLRHWQHIEDWRWRVMIPLFCQPVWDWAMEAAAFVEQSIVQYDGDDIVFPAAEWTPPSKPMIDPVNEGLAYSRNIRAGLQTWSEVLRELGYDPDAVLEEYADDFKKLDTLKLIFDSDPRQMTQAGQLQGKALPKPVAKPAPAAAPASEEEEPDREPEKTDIERTARYLRLASGYDR